MDAAKSTAIGRLWELATWNQRILRICNWYLCFSMLNGEALGEKRKCIWKENSPL